MARTPRVWPTAVLVGLSAVPSGWWRRPPFLPVPPRQYLEFRLTTQYGDADAAPVPADVVAYLEWCREWRRSHR